MSKGNARLAVIDLDTGELQTDLHYGFHRAHKKPKSPYTDFLMAPLTSLFTATRDLPGGVVKLLNLLFTQLEYGNWLHVNQSELAKEFGVPANTICIYMRKLVEAQIIFKSGRHKGALTYRLHPNVCWCGNPEPLKKALQLITEGKLDDYAAGIDEA